MHTQPQKGNIINGQQRCQRDTRNKFITTNHNSKLNSLLMTNIFIRQGITVSLTTNQNLYQLLNRTKSKNDSRPYNNSGVYKLNCNDWPNK